MRYPGHFDDLGLPVTRRIPERGQRKPLDPARIDAIARFVEERDTGSRNEPASTIRPSSVTYR